MNASEFIIAIAIGNELFPSTIAINTKLCWESEGYLTDEFTDEEWEFLTPILENVELCELTESLFEAENKDANLEEIREQMVAAGFEYNKDFEAYINSPH